MRPTTRARGWMLQEALWVVVVAAIASNISVLAQIGLFSFSVIAD